MKKIVILALVPAFAFLLSGCGAKNSQKDTTPPAAPGVSAPQKSQTTATASQPATQDSASAAAAKQQAGLTALPADDKTAIDTEIGNMDKELGSTENSLVQEDLYDTQMGL